MALVKKSKVKKRNPLVVVVKFKSGSGFHVKSNKAMRKQINQDTDWSKQ